MIFCIGANEDATSRRRSQSTKVQKKQATSHVFALKSTKDADDEDDYLQENQYEMVLDGTVNLNNCLMHVITPKHSY